MNVITDTLRSLVRRKLWPVALLLAGALVAVPITLAKEPETAPAPAAPRAAKDAGLPATFVSVAEDGEVTERRRVLGAEKDPFEPAPIKKQAKKKQEKDSGDEAKTGTAKKPAAKGSGGAAAAGGGGGESKPSAEPPVAEAPAPAPKPTVPRYSIKVRFGQVDGELASRTVQRLTVLPSEETPLLVYRGVEAGGKVAVFELTGSVVAEGDGKCEPKPQDCQILKLRAGETEFITIADTGTETDAQYQLEVEKIYAKKTAVTDAEDTESVVAGRTQLRKWSNGRGARYAFDAETGALRKLSAKAAKRAGIDAL